ncbi:MAG: dihydroorotate dehydrogenase 2 [Candidatus Methanofastidiosum methylothiophilum]|uniref:Dihydroorotate dehydrogenase 2 n=1 Tax=Candidatus Methanofastidiosum methylothiophilum TaxID=1705564 RepID=A0A150ITG4_9EURY|nr:MAG: dihydroorotate dehydrogenase 2 [Candidatus Methanofastidiosum methylthiophilus]KYC47944.1 MAG: dihydroorotate dehydrogenase 2 [Candidatus Methanofastidiosum methylthiophilus]KYC50562.1 MAG: dihydroorotate dehydrogenase 2 [Candidatus Methanofastidiosum methylthiophilus]
MIDLSTNYMGLKLKNPIVASSSYLWEDSKNIKKAEKSGAAAVVLHSLFEEQLEIEQEELNKFLLQGTESYAEAITYFPEIKEFKFAPDEYVELIKEVKSNSEIPIIGSLNGVSDGGWIKYAKKIEDAGADALELNIYFIPTDISLNSEKIEENYSNLVKSVKQKIKIPLAVKLSPYFTSTPHFLKSIEKAGADAFVIFNRFYQPDIDTQNLEIKPNLVLSTSEELRLRLRWAAIMYGKVNPDIAITGGVHTGNDVIKTIMAGAKVSMMTSALIKNEIEHITKVLSEINEWLLMNDYKSIKSIHGLMSQEKVLEPSAYERANYMKTLGSYK